MSLGGLMNKALVQLSGGPKFESHYGQFSFFFCFFVTTPKHICIFGVQRVKHNQIFNIL